MPTPIIDKLNALNKKNTFSFHMPGHKRKKEFMPFDPISFDITEIDGFDNFHNPSGIILKSQKLCAELFGADKSFYLVNGTTSGIISAIYSVCKENDKILIGRNCHKSVYSGILLSGAKPVYILPEQTFFGTSGVISPKQIEYALSENPDIKAAVITSPTYEGLCSDIKEIARILHNKNIPLIVDEAHGAHFKFSDEFPDTAVSSGADITVQSLHKTLPVFTQCSVLHLKRGLVDENKISFAVSMFTTTSPSYVFMASIDNCQNLLSSKSEELFSKYIRNLKNFYENIKNLKNIKIVTKYDISAKTSALGYDFGKIVCLFRKKNIFSVEKILKKDYNINIEMKGINHILFMTSICDNKDDFLYLEKALYEIDSGINGEFSENDVIIYENEKPVCVMTPKEALFSKKEKIPVADCYGLVCAEFVIPYPPGIPIVVPGEIITSKIIENINISKSHNIEIIGPENPALDSLNVII